MNTIAKSIFPIITIIITMTGASHAEMSAIELDTLNGQLYEKLKEQNYLEFKQITNRGELSACSLEFGQVYRDHTHFGGDIVQIAGSWNQMYTKGKNNGYTLKLVAKHVDLKMNKIDFVNPKYLDLQFLDQGISKFKIIQNVGDNKSLFQGYDDGSFAIAKFIAEGQLRNSKIKFSFSDSGFDKDVEFSSIVNKSVSEREIEKFEDCSLKIAEKILADLENIKQQ